MHESFDYAKEFESVDYDALKQDLYDLMTDSKSPKLAEELDKMEYEELLPIEKKLVGWSIAIGILALGVLVWLSHTYFET